jgi:hypothetical protein
VLGTKTNAVTVELDLIVRMNPYNRWGHAAFWSGLGLTAFGAVSTGLAWKYGQDFRDTSWDTEADEKSRMWAGCMYAGFITGGALMITGAVLWILSPGDREWSERQLVSGTPTRDGRGMVFSFGGRW